MYVKTLKIEESKGRREAVTGVLSDDFCNHWQNFFGHWNDLLCPDLRISTSLYFQSIISLPLLFLVLEAYFANRYDIFKGLNVGLFQNNLP